MCAWECASVCRRCDYIWFVKCKYVLYAMLNQHCSLYWLLYQPYASIPWCQRTGSVNLHLHKIYERGCAQKTTFTQICARNKAAFEDRNLKVFQLELITLDCTTKKCWIELYNWSQKFWSFWWMKIISFVNCKRENVYHSNWTYDSWTQYVNIITLPYIHTERESRVI